MNKTIAAILLFLLCLPALAVTQETAGAPPEIEPLGTGYVVFLVVVVAAVFAGFWRYYSRPEPEDDKSKQERQSRD